MKDLGFPTVLWIFTFILLTDYSYAVIQRWLPNTNFETPSNWNSGRVPCGNDRAIIPDESPVVYLQVNTTLRELVLPKSGEIILGPSVNLGFTQQADPGCPSTNGDVEFIAVNPKPWFNTANWCMAPTEQDACDVVTPRVDVEKVPCAFDDVVMPRQRSYFIDLSEGVPQLKVKSLKISGSSFTTSTFSNYLTNKDGQRMFKTARQPSSKTSLLITRKACEDKGGCACGNDLPVIEKTICGHVQKRCERPRCQKTFQPAGGCCRMCGALFNITKGYGYDYEDFKNIIRTNFYSDQAKKDINMTFFITYDGLVQLALNDRTGKKSATLATSIEKDMKADLEQGGHKYAIDEVQLMLSTGPPMYLSVHKADSMSGGSVAGIVIGVLIIIIIMAVVTVFFVYKRTGREMPKIPSISMPSVSMPSLPRMPRRTPRATARVPAQPQTASHVDPGFANPLYDSSPFDDGNAVVKEMELMSSTSIEQEPTFGMSAGGGFANPLYGAQGTTFDDPSKVSTKTRSKEPSSSAATGSAKATPDIPSVDTSAKIKLVDIDEDNNSSTI